MKNNNNLTATAAESAMHMSLPEEFSERAQAAWAHFSDCFELFWVWRLGEYIATDGVKPNGELLPDFENYCVLARATTLAELEQQLEREFDNLVHDDILAPLDDDPWDSF